MRLSTCAYIEEEQGVSNDSKDVLGDRHQGGTNTMHALSSRIPAVVWSGALAFVLTVVAGGVWTVLLISNVATTPAIPWAVVVMALLLWLMWQYLGGKWRPRSTSQARHRYLRAKPVSGQVFAWAMVAGFLSVVAMVGYWVMLFQLVKIPARVLQNFSGSSLLTVVLVLVMAALVSSLAEEVGFRGTSRAYWNNRRAARSRSWLRLCTLVWPYDAHRRLIWKTGGNTGFWLIVVQAIVFSILAFGQLARITKRVRTPLLPASADETVG
jgi:hypothetical protein